MCAVVNVTEVPMEHFFPTGGSGPKLKALLTASQGVAGGVLILKVRCTRDVLAEFE